MNFRTTIFLFLLAVAVGVTILIVNRNDSNTPPAKTDEHKLLSIDAADVNRVSITASDDRHTVLQKKGKDWQLVEPTSARAKNFDVDDLVKALVGLQSRGEVDESKKNEGGLDHPSFLVELATAAGKTSKLSFGESSSVGDSLYVLVDDAKKPNVIGNAIYSTLDKPASVYRDMHLVNASSSDIKQVEIENHGKSVRLEKRGDGWSITAPIQVAAETSAVTDLLSSITGLEAASFVDSPRPSVTASLSRPRVAVAFSAAAPTTQPTPPAPTSAPTTGPSTEPVDPQLPGGQILRFGGFTDVLKTNVFVSLSGADVAVVPATAEKSFEKTVLDLRSRDVVDITPDRVSSFTLAMNRAATTQPTTKPAETHQFTIERHKPSAAILGPTLPGGVTLPSTEPANPATAPVTQPTASTTQPTTQLTTGPATAPAASPTTLAPTQPDTAPTSTAPATTTASSTAPTTTAASAATAEAASQPASAPADETAAAKWVFTAGNAGAADEGQVTDLLASLHPLRAEKYVEPEKLSGTVYTLALHVIPATAADAPQVEVFTFIDTGARVDGFYKDLQFSVDHALLDKLTGDFKTRKPAPPPPSSPMGMPPGAGGSPFGG